MMRRYRKIVKHLKNKAVAWARSFIQGSRHAYLQESLRQAQVSNDYLMSIWLQGREVHPNPLLKHGKKYFSQADEDGILLEILNRIGLQSGVCVEVGCGSGVENNTLNLLLRGWPSVWIDAQPLAFESGSNPELLSFHNEFVNSENINRIVGRGLSNLRVKGVDVLSIDVDGNDGYIAKSLLEGGLTPSVIVVEINELIPPPVRFAQEYVADHIWDGTRNSGWSLQSISELLDQFGYTCVACNLETGVNAFFVASKHLPNFSDIPRDLNLLFVGRSIYPQKHRDVSKRMTPELAHNLVRQARRASVTDFVK